MKIKKFLSLSILLILISLLIFYIKNNLQDFKSLSLISPILLLPLILLFIINYLFVGIITKNLLQPLNVKLSFIEAFKLSIVTGFYNLITPFRGGMAVRAVYLKKKHNFTYTNFLATLAASYILIFLVASILGLISVYLIYTSEKIFSQILFLIFLGAFISMTFTIIFSPKIPLTKYKFINKFIEVINGWHLIKNNKKVIFSVVFFSLIQTLLTSFMVYLQFNVFGIEITFAKCIFLSAIGVFSLLVGITPANLGIGEAITVFSALTIGITPVQSLSVAILGRLISFSVLFILGPIFSYQLLRNKPKNE